MRGIIAATVAVVVLAAGCNHMQLRHSALATASILPDLQHQQVVDNLARFCHNPGSLPYWVVTGGGTTQVGTDVNASVNLLWNATTILTESLNMGGRRGVAEQYSMAVVVDPEKLDVMRAAYQWTLGIYSEENREKLEDYFGEDFEETIPAEPWFQCGPCHCAPACACYVGKHCGTAVWVMPEDSESLTRFTLAMLDIATSGPPLPISVPKREVRKTYDGEPNPGNLRETEVIRVEPDTKPLSGEQSRGIGEAADDAAEEAPAVEPRRSRKDFFDPNRGLQFTPTL